MNSDPTVLIDFCKWFNSTIKAPYHNTKIKEYRSNRCSIDSVKYYIQCQVSDYNSYHKKTIKRIHLTDIKEITKLFLL